MSYELAPYLAKGEPGMEMITLALQKRGPDYPEKNGS